MQTVSTLCATGCALGLAAVGYTVGIEGTETSQSSTNPKGTHSSLYEETVTPLPLHSPTTPTTFASSPCHTSPPALHLLYNKTEEGQLSTVESSPKPSGQTNAVEVSAEAQSSLRRRRSQLRRLSNWTLSRSSSSQRPASRALTLSSDSTSPFIGAEATTPSTPNKLIKRSLSQHMSQSPSPSTPSTKKHTFRRPPTSHQRSATLLKSGYNIETSPNGELKRSYSNSSKVRNTKPYRPFFTVQVSGVNPRASSNGKDCSDGKYQFRRLIAREGRKPHLLFAQSIDTSVSAQSVEASHIDNGSDFPGSSRPATAGTLTEFSSSPPIFVGSLDLKKSTEPRNSFSLGGILSQHTVPPWKRPTKDRSARRLSRRAVSAPVPTMAEDADQMNGDDVKRSKRRNTKTSPHQEPKAEVTRKDTDPIAFDIHTTDAAREQHPSPEEFTNRSTLSPLATRPGSQGSPSLSYSISSVGRTQSGSRPSRHSETPSDLTSSQLGSDHDAKIFSSGDEDDGDVRSDTVYDSLRTGATRSSSGPYTSKLESLFDRSPDSQPLEQDTSSINAAVHLSSSIAEEDEAFTTPVRTVIPEDTERLSLSNKPNQTPRARFSVSPHLAFQQLKLGDLEWSDEEDGNWADGSDGSGEDEDSPLKERSRSSALSKGLQGQPRGQISQNAPDVDVKSSLFDWAEQRPLERANADTSPVRPKTVHGKKASEPRGSRGTGRVSSGLHARSQSVPVTPDTDGRRTQIKSKFGTWGMASKGVPEDWNDDFDFDDLPDDITAAKSTDTKQSRSAGSTVVVPEMIREQHTNVLANIGLLREWAIHIEELKELRTRAISLNIINDRHASLFDEVDAMIDLADQEVNDEKPHDLSANSTPGADIAQTDTTSMDRPRYDRGMSLKSEASDATASGKSPRYESSPASITWTPPAPITRPRKDSEAVAQTVIEAVQQRRDPSESMVHMELVSPKKKVPFDTATLKHIVPYVSGLTRKVKLAIRETEGLQERAVGRSSTPDPPLRQAFLNHEETIFSN